MEKKMENKIVRVELSGGIFGMLFTNPRRALDKCVQKENEDGWEVHQIMNHTDTNFFVSILKLVILICTVFIYTWGAGYLLVFKRPSEKSGTDSKIDKLVEMNQELMKRLDEVTTVQK